MTAPIRCIRALQELDEQGIFYASATTLSHIVGCTPQHARRVLDGLVDEDVIRMRLVPHQTSHPLERFRYRALYCLPENYQYQMELGI